jgi:hypothetical protein
LTGILQYTGQPQASATSEPFSMANGGDSKNHIRELTQMSLLCRMALI